MRLVWLLPGLLLLLAQQGCQRQAPGPDECVAFAELVIGGLVRPGVPLVLVRAKADQLVRECLTTPYDRRMLSCVERTGALRVCRHEFERRRTAVAP